MFHLIVPLQLFVTIGFQSSNNWAIFFFFFLLSPFSFLSLGWQLVPKSSLHTLSPVVDWISKVLIFSDRKISNYFWMKSSPIISCIKLPSDIAFSFSLSLSLLLPWYIILYITSSYEHCPWGITILPLLNLKNLRL